MKTVSSIQELKAYLAAERQDNKQVGFVPTMGALHAGHLSLVKRCREENDVCVVSVFVNPTQFNDKHDLETYPRTLDKDCALLETAGCDYVFAPSVEEMYPEPDTRTFDFGTVSAVMEGARRPGFQQIAVIRAMVKQLQIPVEIVACPIVREADGLALSSRNVRLTPEQRQKAPLIARTLKESVTFAAGKSVQEVIDYVVNRINAEPDMRVEYFEIVDGNTMEAIGQWTDTTIGQWTDTIYPVGCITVYCGEVRLIDNIKY